MRNMIVDMPWLDCSEQLCGRGRLCCVSLQLVYDKHTNFAVLRFNSVFQV
jgi:hypothetical protein